MMAFCQSFMQNTMIGTWKYFNSSLLQSRHSHINLQNSVQTTGLTLTAALSKASQKIVG